MNAGQTICLCMIVKNEAPVIRRCLDSVRAVIDYWVIADTGSSDGTQEIIRDELHGVPGELYERPWRDFAHNRSEALALARPHADYTLIIDADDTLEVPEGFTLPPLTADSYRFEISDVAIRYERTQLVRNALPWRYQGVLHEFITADGAQSAGGLPIIMRRNHDGARRRDPQTYHKDAAILEAALAVETDPFLRSRYTFYLAQSYRDCGEKQKAIEAYLRRAELGYWDQEVFWGLYKAAQLQEALDHDVEATIALYLRASTAAPDRAEALHGASRLCRNTKRYAEGFELARRGLQIPLPEGGLFVEPWIYEYGLLDELAVSAYWSGHYRESLEACERLLADGKCPDRQRIAANANFARRKVGTETAVCTASGPAGDLAVAAATTIAARDDRPDRFNICQVGLNKHDPIFTDIIRALQGALTDLGYQCTVTKNALADGAVNIVLGAIVFAAQYPEFIGFLDGAPHIIYQFEQLDSEQGFLQAIPAYWELLRRASYIWEYSPSGMDFLDRTEMSNRSLYLPPLHHSSLEQFDPAAQQDIDVLFYGSSNERRFSIVHGLIDAGKHAVHLMGVYGQSLIEHIRRAKIVINIHGPSHLKVLETARISYLLANRCFVISETSDHNPYGDGVVFAEYDDLVRTCLTFLDGPPERRLEIARRGYEQFRRLELGPALRTVLSRMKLQPLVNGQRLDGGEARMDATSNHSNTGCDEMADDIAGFIKRDNTAGLHMGVDYREFLKIYATEMKPTSYLEIGTETGASLLQFNCDAICIDPAFRIKQDTLLDRQRTLFFQMTSDEFFSKYDPKVFFPEGIDVGFLDGLHHFEALLRDFVNFERCSHRNSVAILHDCLPTDLAMTSRDFRWDGWTGDVWKLLPILARYRPDLQISLLDCPPTGLVVCRNLDARSTVLREQYAAIMDDFSSRELDDAGLVSLRSTFPLVDTRRLTRSGEDIRRLFRNRIDSVSHDHPAQTAVADNHGSGADMSFTTSEPRSLYIDLLIKCVSGSIYRDPDMSPWGSGTYDPAAREGGTDWPAHAHTMIGIKRLQNLRECVETAIKEDVPGDFIETGVWRGGACILMRGVLKAYGVEDRKVYVADSFAGLPPPSPDYPADAGDRHHTMRQLAVSADDVQLAFEAYGLLDNNVVFVKGWFRDTLPALKVPRFAVIRLDGDMYESTIQALEALYPRLSPGGFVVIDDYGAVPGCRKAVEDYRFRNGIVAGMHQIDRTGRFWRKPD